MANKLGLILTKRCGTPVDASRYPVKRERLWGRSVRNVLIMKYGDERA